jgi:hypothetical protein
VQILGEYAYCDCWDARGGRRVGAVEVRGSTLKSLDRRFALVEWTASLEIRGRLPKSGTRDVLLGWGNGWSMGLEECVLHVLTWATAVAGIVLWDGSELDGWAPFWGDAREGYRGVVG